MRQEALPVRISPRSRAGAIFAGVALSGAALATLYAHRAEPRKVEVREVPLSLRRLGAAFDGYRIVQISDLHADRWMTPRRLRGLVERVNRLEPDLVAITGDLVTEAATGREPELADALGGLRAPDGSVAVLGNYDYVAGERVVRDLLHGAGVRELANDVYTVHRAGSMLHVAGVDDLWHRRARLDLVLRRMPGSGAAILLAHEPDFADVAAAAGRFDLQLSGHTHGGQVRLPLLGPVLRPRHGRIYHTGLYEVEEMIQYTNRGLGMFPPRLRLNCRPEITVFTLNQPPDARRRL